MLGCGVAHLVTRSLVAQHEFALLPLGTAGEAVWTIRTTTTDHCADPARLRGCDCDTPHNAICNASRIQSHAAAGEPEQGRGK